MLHFWKRSENSGKKLCDARLSNASTFILDSKKKLSTFQQVIIHFTNSVAEKLTNKYATRLQTLEQFFKNGNFQSCSIQNLRLNTRKSCNNYRSTFSRQKPSTLKFESKSFDKVFWTFDSASVTEVRTKTTQNPTMSKKLSRIFHNLFSEGKLIEDEKEPCGNSITDE